MAAASPTYFELSFCPSMSLVSTVRRFVGTFCDDVVADPEVASRVALAAHELLENAVKFSVDGNTYIRVDVTPKPDRTRHIRIRTRNLSTSANIGVLHEYFADMKQNPDAQEFYAQLMLRRSKSAEDGGLGLGRIAAEAELSLDLAVDGDVVEISAAADVPGGAP